MSASGHIRVIDPSARKIVGCSCGATCPPHLTVVSLPRNDDDWFHDHQTVNLIDLIERTP